MHGGLKQAGEWRQGEAHGLPPTRGLQGRWTLLEEPLNPSGGVHLDRLGGSLWGTCLQLWLGCMEPPTGGRPTR